MKALFKYVLSVAMVAMISACGGGNPEEPAQSQNTPPAADAGMNSGTSTTDMNDNMGSMQDSMGGGNSSSMQGMDMSAGMDMGATGGMGGMDMSGMQNAGMDMPASDDLQQPRLTEQGLYRVSVSPAITPLPINQMHGWVIHVETAAGDNVDDATITVDGGMPAHNHGMPTAPQVTANMGNGDYQVEGVQFQMPGHWVVGFTISAGGQEDSVSYNLNLQP